MLNKSSYPWRLFVAPKLTMTLLGIMTLVWPHVDLCLLTLLSGAHAVANGLRAISARLTLHAETRQCWVPIYSKPSVKRVRIQKGQMYR